VRIAYFDPFSGASGDMILGALIDAGLEMSALRGSLDKLSLPGYTIHAERVSQHGIHGTRVHVDVEPGQPQRDWQAIRRLLQDSALGTPVRDAAIAVFQRLAEAEAAVHGVKAEEVHFHEVGGVDAIIDICGACIGLALLKVDAVYSGAPRLGSGFARSQHGVIPIPAPATAELLARAQAPVAPPTPLTASVTGELLTPTGAAVLTTLADFQQASYVPVSIGYGFGQTEFPWPNALRVFIGDASERDGEGELLLETNIDDLNPQFYELLVERLFVTGALDVWLTPITMKKGRPATQVSVLCSHDRRLAIEDVLVQNSSTLGIRATTVNRTKAARTFQTAVTRWGDVRLKLRAWNGRVIDASPEYDDCLAIAREHDIPIRNVWNEAHRIGEVHVGRPLAAIPE
jgi:uncharacterized protein (TIGR00299 family) protein